MKNYRNIYLEAGYLQICFRSRREKTLVFIGLNPSTAIPKHPDTPWNILSGMCERKGYDGLIIVNLFPKVIRNEYDCTEDNESAKLECCTNEINFVKIKKLFNENLGNVDYTILCGWGNDIMLRTESQVAIERLKKALENVPTQKIKCLGLTKQGHPRSPLARMEKKDFKLFDFENYRI